MIRLDITPNDADLMGKNDSESIQNAVNKAAELGVNKITIPRYNKRTDSSVWIITEAIKLPAYMVVILDNCHLTLSRGSCCNIFVNSNCFDSESATLDGEQIGIKLIGEGNVVLDGGEHNGLFERNQNQYGFPSIWNNALVLFYNVKDFVIENIHFAHLRWKGVALLYARHGRLSKLSFMEYENQPGLPDLGCIYVRLGCNNLFIQDINAKSSDCGISLGAAKKDLQAHAAVRGKHMDISDVIIRNVTSDAFRGSCIRLYNIDGCKLYNILIEGVMDTSRRETKHMPSAVVEFGNPYPSVTERESLLGETSRITVRNVMSRARTVVQFGCPVDNSSFHNLNTYGDATKVLSTGKRAELENVLFDGLFYNSDQDDITYQRALSKSEYRGNAIELVNVAGKNVWIRNLFVSKVKDVLRVSGKEGGSFTLHIETMFADDYGGVFSDIGPNCTVYIDGEEQQSRA